MLRIETKFIKRNFLINLLQFYLGLLTEILVGLDRNMLNLGELNLQRRDFAVLAFAHLTRSRQI